eukprot:5796640-Alexandrium_andersonii.AAC.1
MHSAAWRARSPAGTTRPPPGRAGRPRPPRPHGGREREARTSEAEGGPPSSRSWPQGVGPSNKFGPLRARKSAEDRRIAG